MSVAANLRFLRAIVPDGAAPATFCRMIPYDGTPIKAELARSGHLQGDVCHLDYYFLDLTVDAFFQALNQTAHVSGWIHGVGALTVQLQYVKGEVAVMNALFPALQGFDQDCEQVRAITAGENAVLFVIIEQVLTAHRDHGLHRWTPQARRPAKTFKESC